MFGVGQLPDYAERFVHAVIETRLRAFCRAIVHDPDPSPCDVCLLEGVLAQLGCDGEIIRRLLGPPPPTDDGGAAVLRIPRPGQPPGAAARPLPE
ncbi:MAG: hypothetical protein HYX51_07385 [Chloroflexi bacterium]|nr:hypothetical protein [Chloroflexota bacterium]